MGVYHVPLSLFLRVWVPQVFEGSLCVCQETVLSYIVEVDGREGIHS